MINRIKCNVCVLLAATVCFALGACSGEEGDSMPQVPANPDALCAITPHAVEINQVDASATPLTRSATGEPEQKATYAENLGHNFSAEATLEAMPQDAQTRAGANLATDAQYRIVVYDGSGTIVGNVAYKQGSTDVVSGKEIKLKAGTYRLFAYTFNRAFPIQMLDADNKNVTVNRGADFMTYTNTAFTISATDYGSGKALNISFTRQCIRLTVTIVVEGYTDNTVTSATLDVGNAFGSGSKWDGTTNTDTSILPSVAGTASLTKASGNASTVDCGPSADNPYLITSPCSNEIISILGMRVVRTGETVAYFDFTFPNPVTLVKGGSYRLTIHTGNYYVLTPTNPVTIGSVKWARTNLQQTGSGATAPVSFVATPWDYGSYWNWGMRDAVLYDSSIYLNGNVNWDNSTAGHANQDPCRSLGSGWRLPIKDEHSSLVSFKAPSGTKVRINGTINTTDGNGWASDAKGVVCISDSRAIFLPAAGYRSGRTGNIDKAGATLWYYSSTYYAYYGSVYALYYNNDVGFNVGLDTRNFGHSLRCVQD